VSRIAKASASTKTGKCHEAHAATDARVLFRAGVIIPLAPQVRRKPSHP